MEERPWRTRLTLSDFLAVQHSSNLGDLLGYREDEEEVDGSQHQALLLRCRHGQTLTLASALAYEKGEASSSPAVAGAGGRRTLLDIFCEDESLVAAGAVDDFTWMAFEEHLQLSAALAASSGRDPPTTNGRAPAEVASAEESADSSAHAAVPAAPAEEPPVRVSLMALLEATEGQMGGGGEVWAVAEEEEMAGVEEEAEEEEEEEEDSHVCCVCTERRKGAAFIPCGHTFCRVCSRVLFKRRGSCPLCNAHIVQVLRIF